MNQSELKRFDKFYQQQLKTLKLQGKVQKTIESYSRAIRRVRDYGFLHSNAKKLLALVQLVLHVKIHAPELRQRPVFSCPCCKSPMLVIGVRPPGYKPG